jgi:SAM-dependent methyltransferase
LGGIVALYSIIHLPRERLVGAFRGMRRVLKPGGLLLVAFHRGQGEIHEEEDWDAGFSIALFEPEEVWRWKRRVSKSWKIRSRGL